MKRENNIGRLGCCAQINIIYIAYNRTCGCVCSPKIGSGCCWHNIPEYMFFVRRRWKMSAWKLVSIHFPNTKQGKYNMLCAKNKWIKDPPLLNTVQRAHSVQNTARSKKLAKWLYAWLYFARIMSIFFIKNLILLKIFLFSHLT